MITPKATKPSPREEREAYAAVSARSRGICEGCGIRPARNKHHRLFRSRGGLTTVVNLLDLCGFGNHNNSECHGTAHNGREGEVLGWAVRSGTDPATVPVVYRGMPGMLRADGTFEPGAVT